MQNRTDLPPAFDQRSLLMTFLDYTRDTTAFKCEGLSDADARATPLPASPMMSISGLVSHLRWVEWSWIGDRLLGETADDPWTDPDDPDREFYYELDRPLPAILADYRAQSARYNEVVAGMDLDTRTIWKAPETGEPVTLGWVIMHLVEENARHNGHIDIIRELLDGQVGV
ncbi:DinB family protein [Actinomadura sp. GTD37]|uniref:DinB family protein n=1 Tax=Actinomadura sp. GTD37 TaxID=1778030 RepID=UPI0035C040CC